MDDKLIEGGRELTLTNEESLERFLVTQFEDYNLSNATRCHIGFNKARAEIEKMFEALQASEE